MPNVTELATSQLNHSPHDVIRIELVEDLDIPAPIREPARIIVKWPQRTTMCEPRQFPEIWLVLSFRVYPESPTRASQGRKF